MNNNNFLDASDDNIIKLTKKFIIDMLNAILFSNVLNWNGIDQYNELPIVSIEDDKKAKVEQRSALFLHRKQPLALRVLVTATENMGQKVCYRVVGIKQKLEVEDFRRTFLPMEQMYLDFSIADTNLGVMQDSSYSFAINFDYKSGKEKSIVSNLLLFLMESDFVAYDQVELYKELLDDVLSLPPVPGDPHFKPVYGVNRD